MSLKILSFQSLKLVVNCFDHCFVAVEAMRPDESHNFLRSLISVATVKAFFQVLSPPQTSAMGLGTLEH